MRLASRCQLQRKTLFSFIIKVMIITVSFLRQGENNRHAGKRKRNCSSDSSKTALQETKQPSFRLSEVETDSAKWHNLFRLFVQQDKRAEAKLVHTGTWKQPLESSVEYAARLTPKSRVAAIYNQEPDFRVPANFRKTSYFSNSGP